MLIALLHAKLVSMRECLNGVEGCCSRDIVVFCPAAHGTLRYWSNENMSSEGGYHQTCTFCLV